jgi:RNA polymerase sigma-70 factor (ECF subfamily)
LFQSVTAGRPAEGAQRQRFEDVYREHVQLVARWAVRLGGPIVEAEDVVQEVFMIAHRELPKFRADSRLSTWLFGITQNVVRYRRRKESVRRWFARTVPDRLPAPVSRPTPVEDLERREATRTVYAALEGMREKYRTIFILFELDELSGAEIAALTGLPPATVRVRLFRARALFEERLRAMAGGAV